MKTEITTYKNGLRIATLPMTGMETAAVSIWTDTGTRNEVPEENGISHLLEHMLFKGTKKRNALQIAEAFDNVGGHVNAYTTREHTVYYGKVLKEHATLAFDVLIDMVQNSTLDEKELALERGVVVQEIGQSFDTPDDIIYDYHQASCFPEQPVGRPVLGTEAIIGTMPRDTLERYYKNRYQPQNTVIAAAGNITHKQTLALVEQFWADPSIATKTAEKEVKARYEGGDCRKTEDLEQLHFMMGFEGVPYDGDALYAMQILNTVLSGGMSSRLFQEIREKRGLAYTIHSFHSSYTDAGLWSLYAGTSADKAQELVDAVTDVLLESTHNISVDEFARAKAQVKSSLLMDKENCGTLAEEIGRHIICHGRHIPSEEVLAKVEALDINMLQRMAKQTFIGKKATITALGDVSHVPEYKKILKRFAA
jgi:predicted Zn-dependent peptidase